MIGPALKGDARQHANLMADPQRLEGIVGHQHDGAAGEQAGREVLQFQPRHRIEMGERLVHQDHRPVFAERAGQRRALAHAARQQCLREIVEAVVQADFGQKRARARFGGAPRRGVAAQAIAQQDIVEDRKPRQQQVRLGHVGHRPAVRAVPGRRPASQRSREVLPTPLRPSRQVVRPAGNSSVRLRATMRSPKAMRASCRKGRSSRQNVTSPYAGTNRIRLPGSFLRTSQPRRGSPDDRSHYEKAATVTQASSV